MKKAEIVIKIVLAILLLLCLLDMPYGFYQLVRFIAFTGLGFLAFRSYKNKNEIGLIIFGSLALLFQPFIKIALGREIWNLVDVIVGVGLLTSLFMSSKVRQR